MAQDNAKPNMNMHVSPPYQEMSNGRLHSDKKHEGCIVVSVLNFFFVI
jgi:hypothetical protein